MIDLSNNNGQVNFSRVHSHHQFRVFLKRSEGTHFADPTFDARYKEALSAGMRVGAYHFARPSKNTPREEANFFLRLLPRLAPGKTLRPCLDLEDPDAKPTPHIAEWASEWLSHVYAELGYHAILYGGAYYLGPCEFTRAPHIIRHTRLWIPAYGRNDGKEYPFMVPKPWTLREVVAHQYASNANVPGVAGPCDISHVLHRRLLDINRLHVG